MKKLLVCLAALSIIACKQEPKDYATFSGKIENQNSDSLFVYQGRNFSKTIKVNEDGTFSDTLKVEAGVYNIYDGSEGASVYLANDMDLKMTLDTKEFDESIKFSGEGSDKSNFLSERATYEEGLIKLGELKALDEAGLNTKIESIKSDMLAFYDKNKDIDSAMIADAKKGIDPMLNGLKGYIMEGIKLKKALPAGSPSPSFDAYENYKGGTTSLVDLKGKYVYVDVWATWCGPCKAEIPSLKKLDKKYHDKNLTFVSLSIDDERSHQGSMDKAREAWKAMIADKELGGVQILAPKGWKSEFVTDYKINGIPRFILIDPSGNIVTADAPRPSDPELIELFDSLSI